MHKSKGNARRSGRSGSATSLITLVALLLVALAVCVWTFYPVLRLNAAEQRQKARFERELADVRKRNQDMRREVARLKTPQGVEKAARERIGLVKPGENVYVVTSRPETRTADRNTADSNSTASVWRRIFSLLLGEQ